MTIPARPTGGAPFRYPYFADLLPDVAIRAGRYVVRFARSAEDLEAVLRLRFEVFNLELGEGLDRSFATGRDEDEWDPHVHHLVIERGDTGEVVGTYRMQTAEMAERLIGFYSAGEFDLGGLPAEVVRGAVEIGRACVARAHRNGRVLHLLWRGLAAYMSHNRKRFLFGCCSLPTQDPADATRALAHLAREGYLHPEITVPPRPELACAMAEAPEDGRADARIPALFQSYLNLGAEVCGPPAIDRQFKTIDFFVLLDVDGLAPRTRHTFFRDGPPPDDGAPVESISSVDPRR